MRLKRRTRRGEAFTLLELLVVVGLVVGLSLVLIRSIAGGGKATALQAGQAMVANVVMAARAKAAATGRKTRVLVNVDVASERFLRVLVLQQGRGAGSNPASWETVDTFSLPDGIYIVPASLSIAEGLVAVADEWKRASGSADLVSDALVQVASLTLEEESTAEQWAGIAFTPNGTLANFAGTGIPPKGMIIVATGTVRAGGGRRQGESPVQLTSPDAVRGLAIGAYGIPALLNERSAF